MGTTDEAARTEAPETVAATGHASRARGEDHQAKPTAVVGLRFSRGPGV